MDVYKSICSDSRGGREHAWGIYPSIYISGCRFCMSAGLLPEGSFPAEQRLYHPAPDSRRSGHRFLGSPPFMRTGCLSLSAAACFRAVKDAEAAAAMGTGNGLVILPDFMLPGMDGAEPMREMREFDTGCRSCPGRRNMPSQPVRQALSIGMQGLPVQTGEKAPAAPLFSASRSCANRKPPGRKGRRAGFAAKVAGA